MHPAHSLHEHLRAVAVIEPEHSRLGFVEHANGDVYIGEWKHNEPDGLGTMNYANGNIFEGLTSRNAPAFMLYQIAMRQGGGLQFALTEDALVLGAVLPDA